MSVAIPDPQLDQNKQQRIEIATRLMEAWLRGGGPGYGTVEDTAERFAKLAAIIQQKA